MNEKGPEISINVKAQDGNVICFRMRTTTLMKKMIESYCQRSGLNTGSVRFIYDGERIRETDTPGKLGMEDGDEIDAMIEQHGGKEFEVDLVSKNSQC